MGERFSSVHPWMVHRSPRAFNVTGNLWTILHNFAPQQELINELNTGEMSVPCWGNAPLAFWWFNNRVDAITRNERKLSWADCVWLKCRKYRQVQYNHTTRRDVYDRRTKTTKRVSDTRVERRKGERESRERAVHWLPHLHPPHRC